MKKAKKDLLEKTYHQFMQVGFNELDPAILENIADKSIMGFGTTFDEKIFSMGELEELSRRQHVQSKGMKMTWNTKLLHRHISEDENTAVYADDVFLHVQMDDGTIEMYLRISVVLEYSNDKWLVVHWHASKPEEVESEKDTFGIDPWKEKAEALEKVVTERTADLLIKNRELEIEAALERVRTVAMSMAKPDGLLSICEVMYHELNKIGFEELRNAMINIHYDDEKYLLNYDYSDSTGKTVTRFQYNVHEIVDNLIYHASQSQESFTEVIYAGKDLEEWKNFRKQNGEGDDSRLDKVDSLYYYFYSIGTDAVGISLFKSANKEQLNVLKRFRNVFDLAYRRYTDITKAETQAREAQIETSLERIRSCTMGMQKSNELRGVAALLSKELISLGITQFATCGYVEIEEKNNRQLSWLTNPDGASLEAFYLPLTGEHIFNERYDAWKRKDIVFKQVVYAKELKKHLDFAYSGFGSQESEMVGRNFFPDPTIFYNYNFSYGYLSLVTGVMLNEADELLLARFTRMFEQTYSRFLDLQKAEAQTRESQIQLALERVRARTMAMYKSEELAETAHVLFQQLIEIGGFPDRISIGIADETNAVVNFWTTDQKGSHLNHSFTARLNERTTIAKTYQAWKDQKKSLVIDLHGEKLKEWIQFAREEMGIAVRDDQIKDRRVHSLAFFSHGWILVTSHELQSTETIQILERFASVFNLTYRRFLDLQKAEAQTRESQIQLALERVRARTMAMYKSDELAETARMVFAEFKKLNVLTDVGIPDRAFISTVNEKKRVIEFWITALDGSEINRMFEGSIKEPIVFSKVYKAWKKQKKSLVIDVSGNDLIQYLDYLKTIGFPVNEKLDELQRVNSVAFFSKGFIGITSLSLLPPESIQMLERFAGVFDLTYTRFLDLQSVEAQAREAKIETALEKVRSRSLAMHKSEEIQEVINEVFVRLKELEINLDSANIFIFENGTKDVVCWTGSTASNSTSSLLRYADIDFIMDLIKAKENQLGLFTHQYLREQKNNFFNYVYESTALKETPDDRKQFILGAACHTVSVAFSKNIAINLNSYSRESFTENENNIARRFAKVFDQSYTRFLDLQKAEAQAREAKIEAALERVRAKAMAMQNSQDLSDTIGVFYRELQLFSLTPRRFGVGLLDRDERIGEMFTWNTTEQGESLELVGRLKMEGHTVLNKVYESWLTQTEYHPVLRGDEIMDYYKILKPQMAFPDYKHDDVQFGYFFFFPEGGVYAWTEKEMQEDELQIYRRFTSVLSLTYKRYRDLQKAEANARDAIKQAALDSIRADIASMRTISDLDRITPLIWNELTILGVQFIRCGVFIMNDEQQLIHTFLSTPDGKAIAAFHIPYSTPGNIKHVISHWHNNKNYIDHWDEKAFTVFAKTLVEQGALTSAKQYLQTIPHGGFYLHFLPFLQGMLYVGNTTQLSEDEINLIQSLAEAFSTAYARYEDFNKLEAAKNQVDKTLVELKQTQQQLVQSEKMASLGELTAGIAHEIQNPLNFVNNFSEVNTELLEEMKDEMKNGNFEAAGSIANDVIENEQKINHHGKRAGDIVKGMLQHSRSSTGVKEPTDINALCDEYLRLSYHGLRAKDKSFNAEMITNFDNSIGKINIIPQDIGRVLLNLYNNAFYAVNEKAKLLANSYQPIASVTTKKSDNHVIITVSDNGNGIPKNIVDKIFQPFFTTKPTGSGTGLGLSLSYDIVKSHGGEIKVESKEGEGTEFIIQLPNT